MKKATKSELDEFNGIQKDLMELDMKISEVVVKSQDLADVQAVLISNIRNKREQLNDFVKRFTEKYGEGAKLNHITGDVLS